MADHSLTTSPPRQRFDDSARIARTESDLVRAIEMLNVHLASSLVATGKVHHHRRSDA